MPEESRRIATERLKWSLSYQKKHGIVSGAARELPAGMADRVAGHLQARLPDPPDVRLRADRPAADEGGRIYVLEANPNPQLARGEDFAESAGRAGIDYGALLQRILNLGLRFAPSAAG